MKRLIELCRLNGITLDERDIETFERFKNLLKKWGKRINITSVLNDRDIEEKHFFDSLLGIKALKAFGIEPESLSFCDVGSGGGFPGIPLAIALKTSTFSLVESRYKRCVFLEQVKRELGLKNVDVFCTRIEEHQGNYDILLMRAVEDPETAVKITKHLLDRGAILCIYRGKEIFRKRISGFEVKNVFVDIVGTDFNRHFLFIKKQSKEWLDEQKSL